ncbi:MAG: hypothetical protein ACI9JM_002224 [Halioglobus sp.]|jgi:hypothetical protein
MDWNDVSVCFVPEADAEERFIFGRSERLLSPYEETF